MTLLLVLVASVIGGLCANPLSTGDVWELNVIGFIVVVVSAVALFGPAEGVAITRS